MKMRYKTSSLYIHIPFCKNICSYCDFKKFIYNQQRVDSYFTALFVDLNQYKNNKYKTIYIGGGTPSCINHSLLEKLLKETSSLLDENYSEFCIESNVEDINEEFLSLLVKYKVSRLSIGVQTFNDKFIKLCNRHHNKQMAIDNIKLASKYIKNVSIDMIFAFPNQSIYQLKKDIEIATTLPIKHISYYSLLVEENTVLWAKKYENVSDDIQAKMYKIIYNKLSQKGFKRYEISNFSKGKKYQSNHNKTYWHNEHYDAVGIAASGYKNNVRFTNNTNIVKYMNFDFSYSYEETLDIKNIMFEEIMLRLRLDEGLDISKFNKKFHIDFLKTYDQAIKINKKRKLIKIKNQVMTTTFKGSLLLNDVLQDFLD